MSTNAGLPVQELVIIACPVISDCHTAAEGKPAFSAQLN
jgi:hypothetical protein